MITTEYTIEKAKFIASELSNWSDQDLRESADALRVKYENIKIQEQDYLDGNLINYDEDWYRRLRGAKLRAREDLRFFKTELRKRGLIVPNIQPRLPDSRRCVRMRYDALVKALFEKLDKDQAREITQLGRDIFTRWKAENEEEGNSDV